MAKTAARKSQKRRATRKPAKGGMWSWYLAGVLSVGAAVAYDHRADIIPLAKPFYTASIGAKPRPLDNHPVPQKRVEQAASVGKPVVNKAVQEKSTLALPSFAMPGMRTVEKAALETDSGKTAERKPGAYYFCTVTLENCVVDGGTFWYGRRKIEIADIRAPRIKQAKCDNERKLGSLAKKRLWELLNAGEVQLAGASGQAARVTVGQGRSVGELLVSEGLARPVTGGKQGWCA